MSPLLDHPGKPPSYTGWDGESSWCSQSFLLIMLFFAAVGASQWKGRPYVRNLRLLTTRPL